MIIDTSAIIAILNDEPERRAINEVIKQSDTCLLTWLGPLTQAESKANLGRESRKFSPGLHSPWSVRCGLYRSAFRRCIDCRQDRISPS